MAKISKEKWIGCPFRFAAAAIGDKWSMLIIRDIMFGSAMRYSDFINSEEGIATNVLASRLEHLVNIEILEKKADPEDARKSIYLLTEKGCDLAPVFLSMIQWSQKWDDQTQVPENYLAKLLAGSIPPTRGES
ncbi:winged helix-turn-helix transcriptional regulator [Roseibium sediminicola]|uniref:Helix-turn-helix transcriptional regulator n=1 Tax=Roseibium sediminicola TaxID=2933272 RepID=A0ABT0H3Q8_9HYPH|nr:helix-turn-helix domain-containing protein [Roseibium sp. CAU 1639]MCK7615730.1 helix-turn-helix transcriptional regulator [Roseibium sp. CAU 1639]